jgi:hypothetical protein
MATLKIVSTRLRSAGGKKSASIAVAKMPKLASPTPSAAWRTFNDAKLCANAVNRLIDDQKMAAMTIIGLRG